MSRFEEFQEHNAQNITRKQKRSLSKDSWDSYGADEWSADDLDDDFSSQERRSDITFPEVKKNKSRHFQKARNGFIDMRPNPYSLNSLDGNSPLSDIHSSIIASQQQQIELLQKQITNLQIQQTQLILQSKISNFEVPEKLNLPGQYLMRNPEGREATPIMAPPKKRNKLLSPRRPITHRMIHGFIPGDKRFWAVLIEDSDPTKLANQTVCVEPAPKGVGTPATFIQKLWNKGYKIRQVLYAHEQWVVLADKRPPSHDRKQGLSITAQFPKKKIASIWRKKQRVTFIGYSDSLWILITEQREEGDPGQRMATKHQLTKKDIQNFWSEGYKLHTITYGADQWVLIGDKCEDPFQTQTFFYSTEFPEKRIYEYFKLGKRVHTICYSHGEDLWAMILDNYESNNQQILVDNEFPQTKLQEMGLI